MAYLREKNDMVQKWKAEELELHKQRLEVEIRKQDEFQKQQQAMMQMMAQQQQQFQMFVSVLCYDRSQARLICDMCRQIPGR